MRGADRHSSCISQYEVFSQLRFPLIVLVTFAHSYAAVDSGYSLLGSAWNTCEFLKLLVSQTLVKVAVPVFFIMSGYLFFANMPLWDWHAYAGKLRRRAASLLLPYVVWNVLMVLKLRVFSWRIFWDYIGEAGQQTDWFGQHHLMTAPLNMPLWFLRDLMVMALLAPVVYWSVRRLGFWLLGVLMVVYLSGVCPFVPGLSAYAVFFFTFGAFFAIRQRDLLCALRRVETVAYVLSALFGLAMLLSYHETVFSSLMLAFRLTGAVAVFCLAGRVMRFTARRLPASVSGAAYFIYLAHFVLFFSFVDTAFFAVFGSSVAALSLHYLLAPLIKAALFVGLWQVWRAVRGR